MGLRKVVWAGDEALDTTYLGIPLVMTDHAKGLIALSGLTIHLDSVVTATEATVRLTSDEEGDTLITPDFTADINLGETTVDAGSVVIDFARFIHSGSDEIYVFIKLDAGTANANAISQTYSTE